MATTPELRFMLVLDGSQRCQAPCNTSKCQSTLCCLYFSAASLERVHVFDRRTRTTKGSKARVKHDHLVEGIPTRKRYMDATPKHADTDLKKCRHITRYIYIHTHGSHHNILKAHA